MLRVQLARMAVVLPVTTLLALLSPRMVADDMSCVVENFPPVQTSFRQNTTHYNHQRPLQHRRRARTCHLVFELPRQHGHQDHRGSKRGGFDCFVGVGLSCGVNYALFNTASPPGRWCGMWFLCFRNSSSTFPFILWKYCKTYYHFLRFHDES